MQQKTPSLAYKVLTWPARLVQKAYTLLTLHTSSWWSGLTASWGQADYLGLARAGMRNPYVFQALRLISGQLASIPLLATKPGPEDEDEEVPDHPLLFLLRRPTEDTGWIKFARQMIEHLMFGGEIFLYSREAPVTGMAAGRPGTAGLELIRPDRIVEFIRDSEDKLIKYRIRPRRPGPDREIDAALIQHLRYIDDPEDRAGEVRGYPLMMAAYRAAQMMEAGEDWNKSVSQNKGRLPGFFKYTGTGRFQPDQYKRTKESIQEAYAKDAENSRPGLLEGDYDFIEASQKPTEADWLEGDKQAGRKIAIGLGVGSALLGDSERQTKSNLEAEKAALLEFTVLPLLDWLLDELSARYMPKYATPESRLTYNGDQIEALQENQNEKYTRMQGAVAAGLLSPNEARGEMGWDPRDEPEADALYHSSLLVPLVAPEEPEPEEPAPFSGDGAADDDALDKMSDRQFDVFIGSLLNGKRQASL